MVVLHVKKGDQSQFLYETTVKEHIADLVPKLVKIYNGRLKIDRLYYELETLAKHGIVLPANMQGLTDEQITELKLVDSYSATIYPSGGTKECKDPIGRRTGNAPTDKMGDIINKTRAEAREDVSKKLVDANKHMTYSNVQEALDKMKGAVTIVYPMGLPPYDPIRLEFEDDEDLTGTQASKEILEESGSSIWFSTKEMSADKTLEDYIGKNEKTKVVVKLQKRGGGAPSREPVMTEDEQKRLMAHYHKKQEEMKRLDADGADAYLNSKWADSSQLKKQFQGLGDIKWGGR